MLTATCQWGILETGLKCLIKISGRIVRKATCNYLLKLSKHCKKKEVLPVTLAIFLIPLLCSVEIDMSECPSRTVVERKKSLVNIFVNSY